MMLVLLLATWFLHQRWPLTEILVMLTLLLLMLWRYAEQRHEATIRAHWSAISLTARDGESTLNQVSFRSAEPSRAGGVRLWQRRNTVEYLLKVMTDPTQYVMPEGHVEEGEELGETAVREVHEETGAPMVAFQHALSARAELEVVQRMVSPTLQHSLNGNPLKMPSSWTCKFPQLPVSLHRSDPYFNVL